MTHHDTAQCKGPKCGKPVIWAAMTKDDGTPGRIPLDPRAPVYELVSAGGLVAGLKNARRAPQAFVSHFATCPDVNRFSSAAPPTDATLRAENDDLREQLGKAKDEIAMLQERLRRKAAPRSLFDTVDQA